MKEKIEVYNLLWAISVLLAVIIIRMAYLYGG